MSREQSTGPTLLPRVLLGKNARPQQIRAARSSCYKLDGRTPDAVARTDASSDLALGLNLKLQLFDQLGQALSGEWVVGFQCQPTGLRQSSAPFRALSVIHRDALAK
jgi:hypothetical protein